MLSHFHIVTVTIRRSHFYLSLLKFNFILSYFID